MGNGKETNSSGLRSGTAIFLLSFFLLDIVLRTYKTNNFFISGDVANFAFTIIKYPFVWIFHQGYGIIIPLISKAIITFLEIFNIPINEFWFRIHTAVLGSLLIFPLYLLVKEISKSRAAAIFSVAIISVLPIHITMSRYAYGHEIAGAFFLIIALMACIRYFDEPCDKNALYFYSCFTLYFLSHPAVWAFPVLVFYTAIVLTAKKHSVGIKALTTIIKLLFRKEALIPVLFVPFFAPITLIHAFMKGRWFPWGFYLDDNLRLIINDVGVFWFPVIALVLIYGIYDTVRLKRESIPFVWAMIYLAPFAFKVDPNLNMTVSWGYMMIGLTGLSIYACIVFAKLRNSQYLRKWRTDAVFAVIVCLTLASSISNTFKIWKPLMEISMTEFPNIFYGGSVSSNPGFKTCGYFIRKYAPGKNGKVLDLAMMRSISLYYCGYNTISSYKVTTLLASDIPTNFRKEKTTGDLFYKYVNDKAELIIINEGDVNSYNLPPFFTLRATIVNNGKKLMRIYAKDTLQIPTMTLDINEYDSKFDREFSWKPIEYRKRHPGRPIHFFDAHKKILSFFSINL